MSRKSIPRKPALRSWRVTLIRQAEQWVGTVRAPDAETAIKIAEQLSSRRRAGRD
jgi:1,2-phenylacetyl-CoA epoxidase PaaB subunit